MKEETAQVSGKHWLRLVPSRSPLSQTYLFRMYASHYTDNARRARHSVLRPVRGQLVAYAALATFAALVAYGLAL